MIDLHKSYESQNLEENNDPFTLERYTQFLRFFPKEATRVLDIGCNTGRGGAHLKKINPNLSLIGLDCSQERLNSLPECYFQKVYGISTEIPLDDRSVDVVVAGEFLEHLYSADVDKTLSEIQRVLQLKGKLLLTTPNPGYLKNRIMGTSVYGVSHLTQHYPDSLCCRLKMHGFSKVRVYGSGKASRYFGLHFPFLSIYGSYLAVATKY